MRARALPLAAAGIAVAGLGWAARDYRAWQALGPGGLPPTWRGWWRMTRWRIAKGDAFTVPQRDGRAPVTLADLPARRSPRPRVSPHPVPHRQLTDHAPAELRDALHGLFAARVRADPDRLYLTTSHFERHTQAVTLREPFRHHADACAACGEVGHVHPSDGSMHMILGPDDARVVIERGWGERHGLAGIRLGLPATYMLIYAPCTNAELAVVARLLDAAVAFMALEPSPGPLSN